MSTSLSRRDFMAGGLAAIPLVRMARLPAWRLHGAARLAVIADLHHGLAPDALERFDVFLTAVAARKDIDAVWQLGDFCYADAGSAECLARWHALRLPRYNVLGNHDMDKVDKAAAMAAFGMPARYYAVVIGGWRYVVLDLNHFKKDGVLHAYANGNYFTDGATYNWADPDQLAWLDDQIRRSAEPIVLISHQPIGFGTPGDPLPDEQRQVLDLIAEAGQANPKGRVVCCLSGHLHIDRFEESAGVPCLSVNSASYFWFGGMQRYTQPLFAFMEFGSDGVLRVEGRQGAFVTPPPKDSDNVAGRSASLSSRTIATQQVRVSAERV